MNTTSLLVLGTFVKSIICLAGIVMTIVYAVSGLSTKNDEKLKKAAFFFFGTIGAIVALSLCEFLFLMQ